MLKEKYRSGSHRLLLFAIAVCVICAQATIAEEHTFDFQRIIDVPSKAILDLSLINGRVEIVGTTIDKVIIEAVKYVRATDRYEAEEVADHIEIKVRENDGKITVRTNYLRLLNRHESFWSKVLGAGSDAYGQVDYVISVPENCDLVLVGNAADFNVRSVNGDLKIELRDMHGSVDITDVLGKVLIKTRGADIRLSSIEGDRIEIDNGSGNLLGEYLFADIEISQPSGPIELNWIEGDIRIKSVSSAISVGQVRGAIDLYSQSGSVAIQTELDSPNDYFIETESGKITFMIPETSSALLNLQSLSGKIVSEAPVTVKMMSRNRLVGQFGRGGSKVNLSSHTGDVIVSLY